MSYKIIFRSCIRVIVDGGAKSAEKKQYIGNTLPGIRIPSDRAVNLYELELTQLFITAGARVFCSNCQLELC